MNYTAHKIRIGQKVLNLQKMENNDLVYLPNENPLIEFTLDIYGFRFEFDEEYNDHETNHGDGDILWTTKDTYITSLHSVINLDTDEVIELSEGDKAMILEIAQQKFYLSEEI